MAAPAAESPSLVTEDQLLQQRISDHLENIATAMNRMADAMEDPPPPYAMSTHFVNDPRSPCLQSPVHDRIDAIERDNRTLQIAFGIVMTGIAIFFICKGDQPIPLPLLLGMLSALAVGYVISRRN